MNLRIVKRSVPQNKGFLDDDAIKEKWEWGMGCFYFASTWHFLLDSGDCCHSFAMTPPISAPLRYLSHPVSRINQALSFMDLFWKP